MQKVAQAGGDGQHAQVIAPVNQGGPPSRLGHNEAEIRGLILGAVDMLDAPLGCDTARIRLRRCQSRWTKARPSALPTLTNMTESTWLGGDDAGACDAISAMGWYTGRCDVLTPYLCLGMDTFP